MKKIKRLIIFLLSIAVILSAFSSTTVFAANGRYRIEEAKLEVTIPATYTVITRNTPSNAEIFTRLGLSYSAFMSNMKSGSIYLDAVSNSHSEEIVFTCQENIISDFALLSDTVLKTMASTIINETEKLGISLIKYDIYHHSQAKFIRIYWLDSANSRYGLQYYTVRDNMAMNFTIHSYEGNINSRQETVMKTIVDSVKYDVPSPVVLEGEDTDAFVYTDSDSGVKFTVPSNWVADEFNEEREFLDAKFASTKEKGLIICYGSSDVWSEMTPDEKIGLTRADIDNSIFTKADVAQMCNTTEDNVSLVMYNGVEYYKCTTSTKGDAYGLSIAITMTQLFCINNGCMYTFQFGESDEHELYYDFEKLVRSVQYPASQTPVIDNYYDDDSYGGNTYDSDDESKNHTGIILFIVIIIAAGAICTVWWISRKKGRKTKYTILCCGRCGQKLPPDSDFCHLCGAKVEREKER